MRNAQHQPRLLEVVNSNRLEIHKVGGGHHGHGGGLRISRIGNHTVVNPTTDYYLPTFVSSLVKSSPALPKATTNIYFCHSPYYLLKRSTKVRREDMGAY